MGLVGEALERFGLVGARALGCEGLGQSWYGRSRHRALGPGKVQDDKKPEECEQDELRENMMRHHGVVPLQQVLRWGILPGFGDDGIIRRVAVHDRDVGRFPERQVLVPPAAPHDAHHDRAGVDTKPHRGPASAGTFPITY
jgi:hypothetical protein